MARILVVDDDELARFTIREILTMAGHEITEAEDGDEAIKSQKATPFDLIVTDIIMPSADGLEVIRDILRQDPEARIIAISGGGRLPAQTYLGHARKFGATAVLPKPFPPEQLLSLVDDLPSHAAPRKANPSPKRKPRTINGKNPDH